MRFKSSFIFLLLFFGAASILNAQSPSGYTLVKTNLASNRYQWTASNHTAHDNNFFILETVPANIEVQSVVESPSPVSSLAIYPVLPLTGSAPLTIGPFSIPAESSVTFLVAANNKGQTISRDTFSLVSEAQLRGSSAAAGVTLGSGSSPGPTLQSVVAAPNISNDQQPIHFIFTLNSPALATLTLFAVTGEKVYSAAAQANEGKNTLVWNLENNGRQVVASGLYIYLLRVDGPGTEETFTGKVLVLH